MPFALLLALLGAGAGIWWYRRRIRTARRAALLDSAPSDDRVRILRERVPLYARLPPALRERLHGVVEVLLDEKRFVGCDGLEVTEEMRVTIAGQAAFLLLGRSGRFFPGFSTILVYPETYVVPEIVQDGEVEIHDEAVRAGESWHRGPVVLSWGDVLRDMADGGDGCNVVLHEFAHKLDEENDAGEGVPLLGPDVPYHAWARVFTREYERLCAAADRGEETLLDPYGAESPAEFFAVATEAFFEMPGEVAAEHPDLYAQLAGCYRVDPGAWAP